ncbi:phage tail tape measure protein [Clostridium botulinum]|nr:phage tail tape measure protein [Clostridium botulinum]EKO2043680.1 phage tail tape measure protein [Clostridium botulinum]
MASNTEKRITCKMILDNSGFNDKLKGVNAELRNAQSELKSANAQVGVFGQSSKSLGSVQEALSRQVELHSKKVDIYKQSIEKTTSKMKDNIKARDELKTKLEQANRKYEEAVKLYGKESTEAQKAKKEVDRLTEEYKKKEKAVETNAKQIQNYETNMNKANAEMLKAKGNLNKVTDELNKQNNKWIQASERLGEHSKKLKDTGEKITDVGKSITTKVSVPLAGLGAIALKTTADYDDSMSQLKAITNSSAEDMGKLDKAAKDMGIQTRYSAKEASDSMVMLGQAGYSTNQILNTTPAVLNLAQAGAIDLTQSTDVLVSSMSQFGIKTENAAHVADVLSLGANKANLGVGDLAESMKYAGAMANTAGWSIEDTTAAIGLMSNYGIKGSQSGTVLRGAISRLVKPSKDAAEKMDELGIKIFDTKGKMKSLPEVLDEVKKGTSNLTEEQKMNTLVTLFGQEAVSGMNALLKEGGNSVRAYSGELKNADGSAAKAAKTMEDNLGGSMRSLKSAAEGAMISMGSALAPTIRDIADKITELTRRFAALSPETQNMIAKFGMFAVVTGPAIVGVGKLATGFGSILSVGSKVAEIMGKVTLATKGAEAASTTASVATGMASKGITGMGLAAKVGTIALNPWVLGIGAATVAGVALYKHLKKDATPQVDLFADKVSKSNTAMMNYSAASKGVETSNVKISKSTKQAVGAYMDLDKKASKSMLNLVANSNKFSKQAKDKVLKNFTDMSKKSSSLSNEQKNAMTTNFKKLVTDTGVLTKKNKDEIIKQYTAMVNGTKGLTKKQKNQTIKEFTDTLNKSTAITKQQSLSLQQLYKDMGDKIKTGLDKKKEEEFKSQQDFFAKSNVLTTTEEAKILQTTTTSWNNKKKTIDGLQNQINSIIQNAANNHRQITTEEAKTIDGLQKQMKENAVKTLSASEVEQKVIMERLKNYNGRITAEQASEVIKNAEKQRQGAVQKANNQYDQTVRNIIKMRDETKVITKDQADKMLKEAERQRKESIDKAENQKKEVVKKITSMNKDVGESVDTTSGNMLTTWDKLKSWWSGWHPENKSFGYTLRGIETKGIQGKWTGDRHFSGGLTYLHDAPGRNSNYELYDLPRGTRIFNHDASADLVMKTAENVATKVANSVLKNFKGLTAGGQDQTIIVPVNLDSREIARVTAKPMSEELGKLNRRGGLGYV